MKRGMTTAEFESASAPAVVKSEAPTTPPSAPATSAQFPCPTTFSAPCPPQTQVPAQCSGTSVHFCTLAPVGQSCSATSLGWDIGCTSVSQCVFTSTRGCQDNTYPQACWYTVQQGVDCEQDTSTGRYSCNDAATCAPGCVELTFRFGDCRTDTDYCAENTLGNSEDCTYGDGELCDTPSWNVDCLTTFTNAFECTKIGACNSSMPGCTLTTGPGINCVGTKMEGGVNICGTITMTSGTQSVTAQVCHTNPNPFPETNQSQGNGFAGVFSSALLLVACAVGQRFGVSL